MVLPVARRRRRRVLQLATRTADPRLRRKNADDDPLRRAAEIERVVSAMPFDTTKEFEHSDHPVIDVRTGQYSGHFQE